MDGYKEKSQTGLFLSCSIGCGCSLVSAVLLMLIAALLMMKSEDPMAYARAGGAVMLVCAAVSGFISAKCAGKAAFVCGLLGGGMYTAVVVCASLAFIDDISIWYVPIALACALAGSFLGNIKGDKKAKLPSFDDKKYNFNK